jgi:hypothetical protein
MRFGLFCSIVAGLLTVGCGNSASTEQSHGETASTVSLRHALVAAYDRPLLAFARGNAGEFCADFTLEAQRAVAHHRGAATCAAALEPLVRGFGGSGTRRGLRKVEQALDADFRYARRDAAHASITRPAGGRARVTLLRLTDGRWLIADTPTFGTEDRHSLVPHGDFSYAAASWFSY